MHNIARVVAAVAGIGVFSLFFMASAAHDPQHYELFGDAEYVSPGNASARAVAIRSDLTSTTPFGGIEYLITPGETTFAELTTLSTDYMVATGDTCSLGSPRYAIGLDDPNSTDIGFAFAYFGTDSGGAPCVAGTWQNTGDFLEAGRMLDTSQLDGGTFYDPYADALAEYGDYVVTSLFVVVDAGATGNPQTVTIDNTLLNSTTFTYEQVDTTPPTVPVHLSPTSSSTMTSAEFTMADWSDSTDDSGGDVTYIYQSSNSAATNPDGSLAAPVYTSGPLSSSQISTAGTPEGHWYWQVRAVDEAGNMSNWTTPWHVHVDNTPEEEPEEPMMPTTADQCKNGGWMTYVDNNDRPFKNQGQCVAFVRSNGRPSAAR